MRKKLYKISFLIFSAFLFASCSSSKDYEIKSNEAFQKKYGKEIEKIRAERTAPEEKEGEKVVTNVTPPTLEEIHGKKIENYSEYYAYVDVNKFGGKTPQQFMPGREVYETAANRAPGQGIPPDIFEITYNTNLYPAFRKIGAEFDFIDVPPYDAHGVRTAMEDKTYLLAGGDALQRSIDTVDASRNDDDVEISEILISEQRKLKKRQKMERIFGKDAYADLANLKNTEEEEESKKSEKKLTQNQPKPLSEVVSGFVVRTIKN